MNNSLLSNINEYVKEDDELYILGDFAFLRHNTLEKGLELFNRIQCRNKSLIKGNHDEKIVKELPWKEFALLKELHLEGYSPIVMCHHPIPNLNKDYGGKYQRYIHLHGHLHSKSPVQAKGRCIFDIGVDAWSYHPVCINEIQILANLM